MTTFTTVVSNSMKRLSPNSAPSDVTIATPAPSSGSPAAMKPPKTTSMTTSAIGRATISPWRRSDSEVSRIESTSSLDPPTSAVAPGYRSRMLAAAPRSSPTTVIEQLAVAVDGHGDQDAIAVLGEQGGDLLDRVAVREPRERQRVDHRHAGLIDRAQSARNQIGERRVSRIDSVDE